MAEIAGLDTSSIERRNPIVTKENEPNFPKETIDKAWNFVTEAVRREIIENPKARVTVLQFIATPVSEVLPAGFVLQLSSSDERVKKIVDRYANPLLPYLQLPPVSDSLIVPDIKGSPGFGTPEILMENWSGIVEPEEIRARIESDARSGTYLAGITKQERSLIAHRYKLARDVKLLALGAELANTDDLKPNHEGVINLSSGVRIVFDSKIDSKVFSDLLSPLKWEKRRQLKDRVHIVEINGRKYILKEQKTSRHMDTKRHGHIPGLTSEEEFKTAQLFYEKGTVKEEDVAFSWEKPLGSVTYPDGFQFALFEYEEGLLTSEEARQALFGLMADNRKLYEDEYRDILQRMKKYSTHPKVTIFNDPTISKKRPTMLGFLDRLIKSTKKDLSFEDFIALKCKLAFLYAREKRNDILLNEGYTNSDLDGVAYRTPSNGRPFLETVSFDFEYFKKGDPEYIKGVVERSRESRNRGQPVEMLPFMQDGTNRVDMQALKLLQAAYLAMQEKVGLIKP